MRFSRPQYDSLPARLKPPEDREKAANKIKQRETLLEKDLHAQIFNVLAHRRIPRDFIGHGAMHKPAYRPEGEPDFVFLFRGFYVAWEIKLPGRKPDPAQEKYLDWINQHGGHGSVITDVRAAFSILKGLDAQADQLNQKHQPTEKEQ
jgi:hypothetical protein